MTKLSVSREVIIIPYFTNNIKDWLMKKDEQSGSLNCDRKFVAKVLNDGESERERDRIETYKMSMLVSVSNWWCHPNELLKSPRSRPWKPCQLPFRPWWPARLNRTGVIALKWFGRLRFFLIIYTSLAGGINTLGLSEGANASRPALSIWHECEIGWRFWHRVSRLNEVLWKIRQINLPFWSDREVTAVWGDVAIG